MEFCFVCFLTPTLTQHPYRQLERSDQRSYLVRVAFAPSLLQLLTFALLADLLARLAVQTVGAGTAVLFAKTGSAGAAFLPPLLLEVGSDGRQRRQGEESRLLVFGLDVFAQRGCLFETFSLQKESFLCVHRELRAWSCPGPGHGDLTV